VSGSAPLAGVVVVELGASVAAPFAGQVLGDLGAEVVKVEKPEGDDAGEGCGGAHGARAFSRSRCRRT
jgi:crotonobetainyl-CoA:carnitine CoA-transferase CaiB-like acyl-CoA transferase